MEAENKVEQIGEKQEGGRERSTIEFPYLDLENAHQIASGVYKAGGSGCEWEQLAAQLGQAGSGGAFRGRMISAKQFGLVTYDRGKVSLTALGMRIVDPQQERSAKIEAFLQVPLYKAVYEKFKGTTLPPNVALEREMQNMGVASKQADKARQAFQRSAKYAGFFEFGAGRLVMPVNSQTQQNQDQVPPPPAPENQKLGGSNDSGNYHPFIQGLLAKLPEPETEWTIEARAKWLTTAANIFDLMYTTPEGSAKSIDIEVK